MKIANLMDKIAASKVSNDPAEFFDVMLTWSMVVETSNLSCEIANQIRLLHLPNLQAIQPAAGQVWRSRKALWSALQKIRRGSEIFFVVCCLHD